MEKAMVICGFPGVGKSCAANNRTHIQDMESSAFSWMFDPMNNPTGKWERNPEFPVNYIKAIRDEANIREYILVSSHEEVRKALKADGVPYIIVAPKRGLKNEYLTRYLQRGNDIEFIELLNEKWDAFLDSIENDGAPVIWLDAGQYMTDVLGRIAR